MLCRLGRDCMRTSQAGIGRTSYLSLGCLPCVPGGASGAPALVFEDRCFLKVLVNLHNCCEEHIEVYRNDIKV